MDYSLYKDVNGLTGNSFIDGLFKLLANDLPGAMVLLIARSADPSFPSDHATGAFALAFGVWLYDRAIGSALLVVAALLSFSRIYVGTHYPGDVIAGALIGVAMAGTLYLASPTRRLIEGFALRAGRVWDALLHRGSSPHAA
jgi:membrane-associated phospholipid phosphatase